MALSKHVFGASSDNRDNGNGGDGEDDGHIRDEHGGYSGGEVGSSRGSAATATSAASAAATQQRERQRERQRVRVRVGREAWGAALASAAARDDAECAICMGSLWMFDNAEKSTPADRRDSGGGGGGDRRGAVASGGGGFGGHDQATDDDTDAGGEGGGSARGGAGGSRGRVLLSCSHVFHAACVSAFERFHLASLAAVAAAAFAGNNAATATATYTVAGGWAATSSGGGASARAAVTGGGGEAGAAAEVAGVCVCPMCRAPYDRRPLARSVGYRFAAPQVRGWDDDGDGDGDGDDGHVEIDNEGDIVTVKDGAESSSLARRRSDEVEAGDYDSGSDEGCGVVRRAH
jgi:hypothetical protein